MRWSRSVPSDPDPTDVGLIPVENATRSTHVDPIRSECERPHPWLERPRTNREERSAEKREPHCLWEKKHRRRLIDARGVKEVVKLRLVLVLRRVLLVPALTYSA